MDQNKIFVNHEGDHFRTRLTHSLEVAQFARGVSKSLALNEYLWNLVTNDNKDITMVIAKNEKTIIEKQLFS